MQPLQVPFQPTSTAPAPGTTQAGSWEDFIYRTVYGIKVAIETPPGTAPGQTGGGWGGTTYPLPNQAEPASDNGALLLIVVIVVIIMVSE